jgi:hypothetical protein
MSLLAQRNFAGGELSPALYARTDTNKYATGLREMFNCLIQRHGGATNRPGTLYLGTVDAPTIRLIPFVVNSDNSYLLVFRNLFIDIWQNGALHSTIASPYVSADLSRIQYVQSADVMTLTHKSYPVKEVKRTGSGPYVFTIGNMSFTPKTPAPSAAPSFVSGPAGAVTHDYVMTYINPLTQEESLVSPALTGAYAEPNSTNPIILSIPANATYREVVIYKKVNGRYGYLAMAATGAQYRDIGSEVHTSDCPPENKDILNSANNYPGVVGYYQQRLCFASSNAEPEKNWMSRSGRFNNFSSSSPIKSDDSISFTAAGRQVNEVRHLVDAGALVMFTSGAEWTVQGADGAEITPASIQLKQTSYNGSSFLPPLGVGGNYIYKQARGSIIRDLAYEMASDGYRGNDLTVFSSHLFEGRDIVDWTYQQVPNSIVWAVRDDGIVLGLTYIKEHMIFGWHRHDFGGVVENVCSIPGEDEDEVYFIIKREIDGNEVRYLEKLTPRFQEDENDLIFMDSAMVFTNPSASATPSVITGLDHLEGLDVSVFADNSVIASPNNPSYNVFTVEDGEIELPRTYERVVVGIPYMSDLETLDIDMIQGSLIDRMKKVSKVSISFEKTRGVFVGAEKPADEQPTDGLMEVKYRKSNIVESFTGIHDVSFRANWSRGGRMFIRQVDPVGMTVLALTPSGLIPGIGG